MTRSVRLIQSLDDRDVVNGFNEQLRLLDKIERRLGDAGQRGGEAGEQSATAWLSANRTLGLVSQTTTAVISGLEQAIALQSRLRQDAERSAESLDASLRKFLVQQGPGGLSLGEARAQSTRIATEAGVSQESVLRVGKQLLSTGFRDPLQQGGTAEAVIAFLQSTAQDVEQADLEGVVSAFAQQLNASGQDLTGQNLLRLAVQTRGLFGATPLEAPDLVAFSQARGVATNLGLSQQEFLATSAVLKEQLSAEQGATGFGNFLTKLSAPRGRQDAALRELGLEAGQVDFVGESFGDVARTIAGAVDALPENRRSPVLGNLFGTEKTATTSALAILEAARTGKLDTFQGFTEDVEGFASGVNLTRGGLAQARARVQAQATQEAALLTESGGVPEILLQDVQTLQNVRRRRINQEEGDFLGQGTIDLLDAAFPQLSVGTGATATQRRIGEQALERGGGFATADLLGAMERQAQLLERQNALLEQQALTRPEQQQQRGGR